MAAHIAALRTILMTYHTYSPELGYVQGKIFGGSYSGKQADAAQACQTSSRHLRRL